MKPHYLDQFYTIDSETGDYIIEISLNDYDDIFNSWDSSVYNIRDLDSSLKSFIQECSDDVDLRRQIVLRFNMQNEKKSAETETLILKSIRNYFHYRLSSTQKRLRERRKKAFFYIGASLIFTLISILMKNSVEVKIIGQVILQGLTVGGWIFLWEACSLLFLQRHELTRKKKEYRRLLEAPVRFRYR